MRPTEQPEPSALNFHSVLSSDSEVQRWAFVVEPNNNPGQFSRTDAPDTNTIETNEQHSFQRDSRRDQIEIVTIPRQATTESSVLAPDLDATVVFSALPFTAFREGTHETVIRTDWWVDVGPLLESHRQGDGERGDSCCAGDSCRVPCEGSGCSSCGDECTICFEEMVHGQLVTTLPCKHTFHHSCIADWLNTKLRNGMPGKCPLCNRELVHPTTLPPKPEPLPDQVHWLTSLHARRQRRPPEYLVIFGRRLPMTKDQLFASLILGVSILMCLLWMFRSYSSRQNFVETPADQDSVGSPAESNSSGGSQRRLLQSLLSSLT